MWTERASIGGAYPVLIETVTDLTLPADHVVYPPSSHNSIYLPEVLYTQSYTEAVQEVEVGSNLSTKNL